MRGHTDSHERHTTTRRCRPRRQRTNACRHTTTANCRRTARQAAHKSKYTIRMLVQHHVRYTYSRKRYATLRRYGVMSITRDGASRRTTLASATSRHVAAYNAARIQTEICRCHGMKKRIAHTLRKVFVIMPAQRAAAARARVNSSDTAQKMLQAP
ncbi:hypothetical protein TNCT_192351 [Trichonephila clavata]|uniref:Uncharacterized protein n=1 Tax=Trichonephila clavata TaxID=2740835 RepID=A0A8X6G5K2_TRICU|nr:hypothetical protein TNCT_192351 [Trichonephila clavata]